MALFYADASSLVKLVREEPESEMLSTFLGDSELVSSEIVVTEALRAIRRAADLDPTQDLRLLVERAAELLGWVGLVPLDRDLLVGAGHLNEPALRTLDAIHVMTALEALPLDGFLSYDRRQAALARLCGLKTFAPGAS